MEYHYTKDIMHVKKFLGHREIDNTMLYIQLDQSLFKNLPDDSFIIRAAHGLEEAIDRSVRARRSRGLLKSRGYVDVTIPYMRMANIARNSIPTTIACANRLIPRFTR